MSYWDPQSPELQELAQLPPGDPQRREFEGGLAMAEPAERVYWQNILRETDRLYAEMPCVDVPPNLEDKLRQIAATPTHQPAWKRLLNVQLDWRHLAGGLATAAVLAGVYFWMTEPPRFVPLDDSFATRITQQAVQKDEAGEPLQIASSDPDTVENVLNKGTVPFHAVVLKPYSKLDLVGGGTCDIAGTPAVYTRWRQDGQNYVLYQFDGRQIGMPTRFYRRMEVPTDLWHDTHHYRVVIWPGDSGECAWALVLESENSRDVFSQSSY